MNHLISEFAVGKKQNPAYNSLLIIVRTCYPFANWWRSHHICKIEWFDLGYNDFAVLGKDSPSYYPTP